MLASKIRWHCAAGGLSKVTPGLSPVRGSPFPGSSYSAPSTACIPLQRIQNHCLLPKAGPKNLRYAVQGDRKIRDNCVMVYDEVC